MYPKQEIVQHRGAPHIQNAYPSIPVSGTQPTQNMQPIPVGGTPPMQNMPPTGQANNIPMGTQSPYGQTGQLNVQPVIPVHGYSMITSEYRIHQARNLAISGILGIVVGIGFTIYATIADGMGEFIYIGPISICIGIGITILGAFMYKKAKESVATNAVGPRNTDVSNINAPQPTVLTEASQGAYPAALPPNGPHASSPLPGATFPTAPLPNSQPPPPYMPPPPYSGQSARGN
ncbi:unnamed protein product [Owenia fusiformis]|uniref:Uncharacterized protein n=1 Tax=Owenia fusiformis TaxID=6347 RepID=A0A8J1UGH2_OWEFU|nr:unnamed protein product [Owenia fusiformis]